MASMPAGMAVNGTHSNENTLSMMVCNIPLCRRVIVLPIQLRCRDWKCCFLAVACELQSAKLDHVSVCTRRFADADSQKSAPKIAAIGRKPPTPQRCAGGDMPTVGRSPTAVNREPFAAYGLSGKLLSQSVHCRRPTSERQASKLVSSRRVGRESEGDGRNERAGSSLARSGLLTIPAIPSQIAFPVAHAE